MNRKVILYIGAFITFIFALFHLAFWQMLNWNVELAKVSVDTSAVLQILNIASVYMLLFFASMTIYIAVKGRRDLLSNSLLFFVSGYYLMRIIAGYFFFGIEVREITIWLICLVTAILFVSAAVIKEVKSIK